MLNQVFCNSIQFILIYEMNFKLNLETKYKSETF